MASGLQKGLAVVGGLVIGIGTTYFYSTMCTVPSGMCIIPTDLLTLSGVAVVVTLAAGTSLYFMFKGGGG